MTVDTHTVATVPNVLARLPGEHGIVADACVSGWCGKDETYLDDGEAIVVAGCDV